MEKPPLQLIGDVVRQPWRHRVGYLNSLLRVGALRDIPGGKALEGQRLSESDNPILPGVKYLRLLHVHNPTAGLIPHQPDYALIVGEPLLAGPLRRVHPGEPVHGLRPVLRETPILQNLTEGVPDGGAFQARRRT